MVARCEHVQAVTMAERERGIGAGEPKWENAINYPNEEQEGDVKQKEILAEYQENSA